MFGIYFRFGKPKSLKHLTHSVWSNDEKMFIVGNKIRSMYGVGCSVGFFGIIITEKYEITEYEKTIK